MTESIEPHRYDNMNDFDAYQTQAKKTAIYPKQFGLIYTALGMASETGEFCGKLKKYIRDGVFDDKAAADELSDVLWYLAMCSEELGYDLSEIAQMNLDKLKDRANRGVLSGNGDKR